MSATESKAAAQLWIDNAISAQSTRKDDVLAVAYASIANAYATLALAQEQRLANLLAYQVSKDRSLELETHIECAIAEALGVA